MIIKSLHSLNGRKKGNFYRFLNDIKKPPQIAWYPSAGWDFKALLFLHKGFTEIHPAKKEVIEPQSPDLFIFTDYAPFIPEDFTDPGYIIFEDSNTKISIVDLEYLPQIRLDNHTDIVWKDSNEYTNKVFFFEIEVVSNRFGKYTVPVIYVCVENEAFCSRFLLPQQISLSHIIHVRYGGGCGGGGSASGAWIINILKSLSCKVFITDGHHDWQNGDEAAIHCYPNLKKENQQTHLKRFRKIPGEWWSNHGDVSWNLVC